MTTFLLIRHASHDLLGTVLAGRTVDIELSAEGLREAESLAERLAATTVDRVVASPRSRALATAAPLAARHGLPVTIENGFDEVDLGEWSGRSFDDLDHDREWQTWIANRSKAQPPNGESICAVQRRVVDTMRRLAHDNENATVAIVSHADVVKAALASFMDLSLDKLECFDIAPASVSVIMVGNGCAKVTLVNETGKIPPD